MLGDGNDNAPTSSDGPEGRSVDDPEGTEGSAQARAARGRNPRLDSGSDETRDAISGRVCGYAGCRAALPAVSGRGNRAQYCQDGKTWGNKNLTCKQAAQAVENYRSLRGGDEPALDDTSLRELGTHVEAALSPINQLHHALTALRQELDGAVAEALQDRDAAEQRARDADGRADAAEQRAATAEQTAEDADAAAAAAGRRADEAEADRATALRDRNTAISTQQRAEARLEDARDREDRAERRAQEAGDRAAAAENRLATLTAERDALTDQITQLRAEATDERERAAQAAREAQAEIDELQQRLQQQRDEHAAARDQIRDEAQAEIDRVRQTAQTDIATARAELTQATTDYTTQLGDLRQQIGSLGHEVSSLTERAEDAEHGRRKAADQLQRWRSELVEALAAPDGTGQLLKEELKSCHKRSGGSCLGRTASR